MKTPRDILFEKHHSAQPKLDAIRRAALAEPGKPLRTSITLRDTLRSLRWHFAGMSVVWLFVLLLHANTNRPPQMVASIPAAKIPSPHVMMISLRENRRRLSEMTDAQSTDSAHHRLLLLKPRTEWRGSTITT